VDFTYLVALIEGLILALVASPITVMKIRRIPKLYVPIVALLVLATVINWREIGTQSIGFLLADFAIIIAYASIGGLIGTIPARIWLRFRKRRPVSN
jgi:hypothetical protein